MTMTKTHKDIAVFMVQLSENESLSEQQVVREIADKTRELLNQLRFVLRCYKIIANVGLFGAMGSHSFYTCTSVLVQPFLYPMLLILLLRRWS
jgi:hypothetical protein